MTFARRPRAIQLGFVTVGAAIAIAVFLQAQRVSGQEHIEDLQARTTEATRQWSELRAAVATAESPAEVLQAAARDGMIQPAAVVAVPAGSIGGAGRTSAAELPGEVQGSNVASPVGGAPADRAAQVPGTAGAVR
ncbi:MAG: hypothetical protein ACK5O2_01760 [Microthrixaceae bacterium]